MTKPEFMKANWKTVGTVFLILLTLFLVLASAGCTIHTDGKDAQANLQTGKDDGLPKPVISVTVVSAVPVGEDKVEVTVSGVNTGNETATGVIAEVKILGKLVKSYMGTDYLILGDINPGQTVSKTQVIEISKKKPLIPLTVHM
jgi:hypothetical protein